MCGCLSYHYTLNLSYSTSNKLLFGEQQSLRTGLFLTTDVWSPQLFLLYFTTDELWRRHLKVDPTPRAECCSFHLGRSLKNYQTLPSSSLLPHQLSACLCISVSGQQKPKRWRQKAVWVLIQSSRLLSGSFHMQNTRLSNGQRGTLTITASHWATIGDSLFRLIDKWKGWNSFHIKWPLARIGGSSPISCLKWETEKMSVNGKLSSQFSALQRPFRLHAQNTQWYGRVFKV